jgi:cell division protein FtsA
MSVVQLHGRGGNRLSGGSKSTIIAALDIGSTKICCIIAEKTAPKQKGQTDARHLLKVLGFGQTLSRGVRGGAIVDVNEAECAIRLAVDAAERMAETAITEVFVSVSGGRPQSTSHMGRVRTQTGVVGPRDLENVVSAALAEVSVGKRNLMHLAPVSHSLDGVGNIASPLGLHGDDLMADIAVTTIEPAYLRNLELAVERAHLRIAGFVVAPYAAAKAALTPDELSLGSVVVDLGGALTTIGLFSNGKLVAADSVPLGGLHATHDIAHGLSTTLAHAERMKTLFGTVLPDGHGAHEMLSVPLLGERGVDTVHKVPKSYLTNILVPRLEEIFEHVRAKLEAPTFQSHVSSRVVLTGGGSQLPGIRDLAMAVLRRPIRSGQVIALAGLPEHARHAGFAVATGTLCYAVNPDQHYAVPQAAALAFQRAQMGYARRVGQWLVDAL